jgi:hypothetical protein
VHDGLPPPVTSAQLPVEQVWQAPHEAEAQQVPPTQWWFAHVSGLEQDAPLSSLVTQAWELVQ